jgi:ArsR family transcriptional regulator
MDSHSIPPADAAAADGALPGHLDGEACHVVSEFFSVYGNHTRISIFCALRNGRKTVSELAEHAGVTLQNASQHLRLMRDKGAVRAEREGQRVYYSIADPRFVQGVKLIHDALTGELRRRAGAGGHPGTADPAPGETAET